jgi:hypothetical protein
MTDAQHDHDHRNPPSEYPRDHVVAVLDDQATLAATMKALTGGGFLASEIDASWGPEAAAALREGTGRRGHTGAVLRLAEWLRVSNHEMQLKDRYEEALDQGRILVAVSAPTDERRDRASEILHANGAQIVKFLGKFTITTLSPSQGS